jgi:hypothetical protein
MNKYETDAHIDEIVPVKVHPDNIVELAASGRWTEQDLLNTWWFHYRQGRELIVWSNKSYFDHMRWIREGR